MRGSDESSAVFGFCQSLKRLHALEEPSPGAEVGAFSTGHPTTECPLQKLLPKSLFVKIGPLGDNSSYFYKILENEP